MPSTLTDKTLDELTPAISGEINDSNDYVYVRMGLPSARQSRKMSVTQFRSLMFRDLSATAMDILMNATVSSGEINVLDGVDTSAGGVTAARINYLAGVSPGVSSPNKVLVLGPSKNVDVLRVQELYLGSGAGMLEATCEELNRMHNVPNGLTKTDLGNLPRLLEIFLDPSVKVTFPDFSTVANGSPFSVVVDNLRVMRGGDVSPGRVNVRMVINGSTAAGGIREELNDALGETTLQFTRGAATTATEVQINTGTNNYTLELTFRGVKLLFSGTFVGNTSSTVGPTLG